jgi:hypothetical protein
MLGVAMLCVVMLSVVMLSSVMLSVVILNVMAPQKEVNTDKTHQFIYKLALPCKWWNLNANINIFNQYVTPPHNINVVSISISMLLHQGTIL